MNNNLTYNQGNPMQNRPAPRGWRERWMQRFGMNTAIAALRKGELTIPNWLTGKSIVFFFVAFLLCTFVFGFPMEFRDAFIAGLSVVLFFYGGSSMSKAYERKKEKAFVRNIFVIGLVIRLIWVLYFYFLFNPYYHN